MTVASRAAMVAFREATVASLAAMMPCSRTTSAASGLVAVGGAVVGVRVGVVVGLAVGVAVVGANVGLVVGGLGAVGAQLPGAQLHSVALWVYR